MTARELAKLVALRQGINPKFAEQSFSIMQDEILKALKRGEIVTFGRLGKFFVANRAQRMGIKPRTNQSIIIPAKKVAKFRAAKMLDIYINS